jgi:phage tail-like protein
MYDQTNTEVARWNFENGWPSKISGPNLDASTNEIAIEELEIAHEKLVREK